jgi:hypothetical protein
MNRTDVVTTDVALCIASPTFRLASFQIALQEQQHNCYEASVTRLTSSCNWYYVQNIKHISKPSYSRAAVGINHGTPPTRNNELLAYRHALIVLYR